MTTKKNSVVHLSMPDDIKERIKELFPKLKKSGALVVNPRPTEEDIYRLCLVRGLELLETQFWHEEESRKEEELEKKSTPRRVLNPIVGYEDSQDDILQAIVDHEQNRGRRALMLKTKEVLDENRWHWPPPPIEADDKLAKELTKK